MSKSLFYGKKINTFQVLRCIAIIFVMIEHVPYWGFGAFGVDIFLVISGFVTMYTTQDKKCASGVKFLIKKYLRIAPLYYVMTILTFIGLMVFPERFRLTTADPIYLLKSILFIPYDIAGQTLPIVRVGWCLNYEMLFYLIFFISMKISHKYRGLISSAIMVIMTCVGQAFTFESTAVRFWLGENLLEFAFGIAAFYLCLSASPVLGRLKEKKCRYLWATAFVLLSTCLMTYMSVYMDRIPVPKFTRVVNWGIPAFLIVVMAFFADDLVDAQGPLVKIGNMSFSIFLIHYYPVVFFGRLAENSLSNPLKIVLALFSMVLSIAIAYPVYILFEKKMGLFFKKHL